MREIVIDTETTGLDPLGGDRVVEIAVMTLAELQTTADEVSPDHDRHNGNGVHGDRIDNVWRESLHGRSAPLQPRPVHHDHDAGAGVRVAGARDNKRPPGQPPWGRGGR
jgi:DNA polymerase III epsilon subunit-like protein